jgi:hypothetical protein
MKNFIYFVFIICISSILMAHSQNGKEIIDNPYDTDGQKNWFATTDGTGDCSSWENPCTFRTALTNCTSTIQDVIYLGAGTHDTDNGSDGNGTDINVNYVRIIGSGLEHNFSSRFANTDAAAAKVLILSGDYISLERIELTQTGQADEDVTYIEVTGDFSTMEFMNIRSSAGAAADIGIEYNNGSAFQYISHSHVDAFHTSAIKTNDSNHIEMIDMHFHESVLALHLSHTDDSFIDVLDSMFHSNTLAIHIDSGVDETHFDNPFFIENTNNVDDDGDFDEVHYIDPRITHLVTATYPIGAGVTVTGHADPYTQDALANIVPASTITEPFIITGINIQSAAASNIYKLEIFWDSAAGTTNSIGVFEFTVGAAPGGNFVYPVLSIARSALPANAYVGAKVASSTGGADAIVITISYQEI